MMNKKTQTWSTDVLIAAMLFVLIFLTLFYIIGIDTTSRVVTELKSESRLIPLKLMASQRSTVNESTVFILDNKVDKARLKELSSMPYSDLKLGLGVKHDFCLYFEDEYGNLINISDDTSDAVMCIGSPNATLNGMPCG